MNKSLILLEEIQHNRYITLMNLCQISALKYKIKYKDVLTTIKDLEKNKSIYIFHKRSKYICSSRESLEELRESLVKHNKVKYIKTSDVCNKIMKHLEKQDLRLLTLEGFLNLSYKCIKDILMDLENKKIIRRYNKHRAVYYTLI